MSHIEVMFLALVACQFADFWTTQRAFKLGAVEANPLLTGLQIVLRSAAAGRWVWLVAPKLAVIAGLITLRAAALVGEGAIAFAMFVLMCWYGFWVLRNHALVKRLQARRG